MTDAALVYGLKIKRIINDSLGVENKVRRLIWGKIIKRFVLFMHSLKKAP